MAVKKNYFEALAKPAVPTLPEDKVVKGLYSGGTLASEAGMLISEALDLGGLVKAEGYVLKSHGYEVIDLGDDMYTQGRPHPMIDPDVRIEKFVNTHKMKNGDYLIRCGVRLWCS